MAAPAPKPPTGNTNDEALEILRRLEPVLSKLDDRTQRIEAEQRRQADVQRKQGEDLAELRGQLKSVAMKEDVARIDGRVSQLPTLWQLAGLIFAIFGAAFVLIRFAGGH
jgi:hypothetical protein